jgi:hypothetical protein
LAAGEFARRDQLIELGGLGGCRTTEGRVPLTTHNVTAALTTISEILRRAGQVGAGSTTMPSPPALVSSSHQAIPASLVGRPVVSLVRIVNLAAFFVRRSVAASNSPTSSCAAPEERSVTVAAGNDVRAAAPTATH